MSPNALFNIDLELKSETIDLISECLLKVEVTGL